MSKRRIIGNAKDPFLFQHVCDDMCARFDELRNQRFSVFVVLSILGFIIRFLFLFTRTLSSAHTESHDLLHVTPISLIVAQWDTNQRIVGLNLVSAI